MYKCRCYGPDKLNLWQFYHLTFKCDLDLQSNQTNVSNGTTPPQGEHLCKIILKSMHKCRSYCPEKLNLWPFIIWPISVNLTFNLPDQIVQMALLLFKKNHCATLFWNLCIHVEVMAGTSSTLPMKKLSSIMVIQFRWYITFVYCRLSCAISFGSV